jgi:membrane-associated phospholipid phosphatase
MLLTLTSAASVSAQPAPESPAAVGAADSAFRPRGGFALRDGLDEDGRRTLSALPKNFAKSLVGVFSKDNLAPFLVGVAATGIGSRFDSQARQSLVGQVPGISRTASSAGGFGVMAPATLGLFVAGRFSGETRFRAFSYDATHAVILSSLYTNVLKAAVQRERPDGSDRLSFPSGHTSSAFALASVAQAHYGWKAGVPSYLAASAIGFSRISNDRHNLSDVLAGATLGVVSGRTVARLNGQPKPGRQRAFSIAPATDPSGSGVGLRGSISW